ncbi:hypothetical protein SBOR_4896 [Sclerotinia borealis F-4128]|uniref:DUF7907 domain-containing protein n=1 Tax=Sclerotinia borealis (strain F-4128) TaxID=1432307 RepID=W9CD53_SCLBF|nr:hypothetical protein SBOR_4896 [Sclerotinia borealis F-4128]
MAGLAFYNGEQGTGIYRLNNTINALRYMVRWICTTLGTRTTDVAQILGGTIRGAHKRSIVNTPPEFRSISGPHELRSVVSIVQKLRGDGAAICSCEICDRHGEYEQQAYIKRYYCFKNGSVAIDQVSSAVEMASLIFFGIFLGLVAETSAGRNHRALNSGEFSLALSAQGYPSLSLNAVPGPQADTLSLIFERQAAYPGTPCYTNSTYLDFDVGDTQPFAMYVPQVGDDYGLAVPVLANLGQKNGRAGFVLAGGQLAPPLDSGVENFFACNGTVNGEDALVLNFGVFNSDGTSPTGCVAATLIQNDNVDN